jgi:hypothetical protein
MGGTENKAFPHDVVRSYIYTENSTGRSGAQGHDRVTPAAGGAVGTVRSWRDTWQLPRGATRLTLGRLCSELLYAGSYTVPCWQYT